MNSTNPPQNKEIIGKKKWPYEAEDLRFDALKYIHPTNSIKSFLQGDGSYFVCGLKGLGKTLVLRAKRKKYLELPTKTSQSYVIIPESPQELDVMAGFNQPESKWDLFSKNIIWRDVWGLSIGLSIISYFLPHLDEKNRYILNWEINNILKVKDKGYDNYLRSLLDYTTMKPSNPSTFVIFTLNHIDWNMLSLISELYANIFNILKQDIKSGCVVFIDQVDKTLEELMTSYIYDVNKLNKLQEIWYSCQIGLIQAITAICTGHHHITIYTTIRQEVLGKLSNDPNYGRYRDKMLILGYEKEDLRKIFIKSIDLFEDEDNLAMPDLIKSEPIKAFLGFDEVHTLRFPEKSENIFDYMYRHTIQRPRDILILGGNISIIDPKQRYGNDKTVDAIKWMINDVAEKNLITDYIGDLKKLMNINFDLAFSKIYTNILSYKDLIEICKEYNKEVNEVVCGEECKNCKETHLFCAIYNIGLLGTVKQDLVKNIKVQKFLEPQYRKLIIAESILPASEAYLLHSTLSHLIEEIREGSHKKFERKNIIVGDGREFPSNVILGNGIEDVPPEPPKSKDEDLTEKPKIESPYI